MEILEVPIGNHTYNLYKIIVFKGTKYEREEIVASEKLNSRIEHEIEKGEYNEELQHIDSLYNYYVPKQEEWSEDCIIQSIEDAIRWEEDMEE